jgi:hypothetical protein
MVNHHHKKFNFAHLTKEIGHDVGAVTKPVFHLGKEVVEAPVHALDKVTSVGADIALPLLVIGGVILFVYVKNK